MKYTILFLIISCTIWAQELIFTPLDSSASIADIVDLAQFSVSVCTFSIDEPGVVQALENAAKRGVKVRVISERPFKSDYISVKVDAEGSLFHMKIIVVDERVSVIGSANFTSHSLFNSYNDILIIEDATFGAAFEEFFDDLWLGLERRFEITVSKIHMRNFAIEERVLEQIGKANRTLDVAMYALTHPKVWAAIKILSSRGVRVRVLLDEWFFKNSNLSKLPVGGIQLKVIRGFTLHSKLFIIDGQVVLTGSANATKSGYSSNAEMLIVIHDRELCRRYCEYFEQIWMEGEIP